ncbi:MAG TPA: DoxX family protein [Edaphocola sp.]|nr:DoxX family protein [Edaphocola sp.]
MENTINISKTSRIIGWALSILVILFLLFDVSGKFMKPEVVVKGTVDLGYPESTITLLGIILLICTILYAFPKTAILGAVLLTGYMGGAIATHIRVENPLFTHILSPVYMAIFFWGGLYLRSAKLRRLVSKE